MQQSVILPPIVPLSQSREAGKGKRAGYLEVSKRIQGKLPKPLISTDKGFFICPEK
jgi:hypothetical protein